MCVLSNLIMVLIINKIEFFFHFCAVFPFRMFLPSFIDPDSFQVNPDTDPVPMPELGFWWQKNWRKIIPVQLKIFVCHFLIKYCNCLSLCLHKGPNYWRSLQQFKRTAFYFSGSFLPSWIRIHNTDITHSWYGYEFREPNQSKCLQIRIRNGRYGT